MFPVDLFIPSRGGVIGRGGSAGFERHRTNDIVGPWVRLPRMGDGPMPGPWGGEGGPWGAEAESSPSPPHSRMSTPRMTTEASSMNGPPSPLRPTPTNKDVCKSAKVVSNMTIRAVLRSVVTKTDPQAATKRGARRSWTTSTNAQAHMYDAVMLCGRGGCHLLPVFNPCQEAARARRMAAQRPGCRPASQTQTGLASMESTSTARGKKWSPPKKNQSQPLGPRSSVPGTRHSSRQSVRLAPPDQRRGDPNPRRSRASG